MDIQLVGGGGGGIVGVGCSTGSTGAEMDHLAGAISLSGNKTSTHRPRIPLGWAGLGWLLHYSYFM